MANGAVYVGSLDKNLQAFNAATGASVWTATTGGAVRSSPAVANGVVYASSAAENKLNGGSAGVYPRNTAAPSF